MKKDSLHQLIQSLNSQEKRLFKLYVKNNQSNKNNNYLLLFDTLCKLTEYDENKLKKYLDNNNATKNLPQSKKYLKDLILKSMRSIDEDRTEDIVTNLMKDQHFLNKKNLFKEQWKKLQKAKETAIKFEHFGRHLEILDTELSYLNELNFDQAIKSLPTYKKNKATLLKKINLYNQLTVSKNIIFHYIRKYQNKIDNENLALAKSEIQQYDEKEIIHSNSFKIKEWYYTITANYYNLAKETHKSFMQHQKLMSSFEEYPQFKNYKKRAYLIHFFNYIGSIFKTENYPLLKKELDIISSIDIKNENNKGEFYQNHTLYSLLYAMNTGKLKEVISNSTEVMKNLKKYRTKINASSLLTLYYNYALIFFFAEDFDNCTLWLEKINEIKADVRQDLQSFASILFVICHYEMNNFLLIESLCRSAKRKHRLSTLEKDICNALIKLSKSKEKKPTFQIIQNKIEANKKRIVGKSILNIWLKSHLDKKESIHALYIQSIQP